MGNVLYTGKAEQASSLSLPLLHVLFLFKGDFRLTVDDVKRCGPLHVDGKVIDIKTIYLDTTFCHPKSMNIITRVSQSYHLDDYISPSPPPSSSSSSFPLSLL